MKFCYAMLRARYAQACVEGMYSRRTFRDDNPVARFVEAMQAHAAKQPLRPKAVLDEEKLVYLKTMEDNAEDMKAALVEPDRHLIDELIVRLRGGDFAKEASPSPLPVPLTPHPSLSVQTVRSFYPSPSASELPLPSGPPVHGVVVEDVEEKVAEVRADTGITPEEPAGEMEAGPEPKKGYSNTQFIVFGLVLLALAYATEG